MSLTFVQPEVYFRCNVMLGAAACVNTFNMNRSGFLPTTAMDI